MRIGQTVTVISAEPLDLVAARADEDVPEAVGAPVPEAGDVRRPVPTAAR